MKYDEEKKEYYKMVNYRKSTDDERPNKIYQKVFEDNKKYGFETDIYSSEFFQFVLGIMGGIASLDDADSDGPKLLGLDIGKKVGLEILARCLKNDAHIGQLSKVMLKIAKSKPEISAAFLRGLLDDNNGEVLMEILFECTDKNTQTTFGNVIKYMLCQVKEAEKDLIESQEKESVEREEKDTDGKTVTKTEERHKSIALRLLTTLLGHMDLRAPRAWNRFGAYLELIAGFITLSADDVEKEIETGKSQPLKPESDAYKIGMEYAFKEGLLTKFGDFML